MSNNVTEQVGLCEGCVRWTHFAGHGREEIDVISSDDAHDRCGIAYMYLVERSIPEKFLLHPITSSSASHRTEWNRQSCLSPLSLN